MKHSKISKSGSSQRVQIVIPIYKNEFSDDEFLSIDYSLKQLAGYSTVFVHPEGLDIQYYSAHFSQADFLPLPPVFFESHRLYNQLCYEPGFYQKFESFEFILILQPDAVIVNPSSLEYWLESDFDYVGAPEPGTYSYDLRQIPPFNKLQKSLQPIVLQGLNGGLSLRRVSKAIAVLNEYPELTVFFRNYGVGIGEDIFFSLMGKLSQQSFNIPNEIAASRFALTGNIFEWLDFNNQTLPFGFHAWDRDIDEKKFILELIERNPI